MSDTDLRGVQFPAAAGEDARPTTAPLREILAGAVRRTDPGLAEAVERAEDWRRDYVDLIGRTTAASAASSAAALEIAGDGVEAMRQTMVLARVNGDVPLADVDLSEPSAPYSTEVVVGQDDPVTELRVPWQGRELAGHKLVDEVAAWVANGWAEPSLAEAIADVVAHPEWLRLEGRQVAVVGAGSEMGPLPALLSWGARVLAIDLPRPEIWDRLRQLPNAGAMSVPVADDDTVGMDLTSHPDDAVAWLDHAAGDAGLVLGDYAYADGGSHVRVTAASDAVGMELSRRRELAWAWLATPTDAFVVPGDVVDSARAAWTARGPVKWLQEPLRRVSRGGVYAPSYAVSGVDEDGHSWGIADVLVPQQGPNYALAKRLQRWRGVVAERAGQQVSFNVAPATWTRSVTKNRVLAAAYGGARHFGVEIFQPETTRMLMAALLVRDLHRPTPARRHPEELFSEAALHGRLWRVGYEPRTALVMAALAGLPGSVGTRGR